MFLTLSPHYPLYVLDLHNLYTLFLYLEYIQPTYVNMHELASMAANKAQERNVQHNESSNLNFRVILIVFNLLNNIKIYLIIHICVIEFVF